MDLQQCITAWNAQADKYNQWDTLDADERCEWIIEQANIKFDKLRTWIEAYPLSVFPEPDFKKAAKVLKDKGMTLDAISASNFRHVLNGVKRIIEED